MPHEAAIIVGAGPIGLACAISAKRRGIDPLVIDAGALANSIVRYPIGMTFFTTPERLEIGGHPLVCTGAKATREEALKYYRGVARAEGLRVRTYATLIDAHHVQTRLGVEPITWDTLVLATGYFDHPNRLGVPGENLPHVHHYFDEAHLSYGCDVVVIGGKNSAVEATLQLFRAGARTTTITYRGKAGEIQARLGSQVVEITERDVLVRGALGNEERIPADRVYPLIGFQPDFELFTRIGIKFDVESGRPEIDADTLETTVAGVHVAGSVTAGLKISEIFIENGRFDGEKIFGSSSERRRAQALYQGIRRETGE